MDKFDDILSDFEGIDDNTQVHNSENDLSPNDEVSIFNLFNQIIINGIENNEDYILLDALRDRKQLSYEKDGKIVPAWKIPEKEYPHLISRIKVMARLNIIEFSHPQNGTLRFNHNNNRYELYVVTVPAMHGEYVSMFFKNKSQRIKGMISEHTRKILDNPPDNTEVYNSENDLSPNDEVSINKLLNQIIIKGIENNEDSILLDALRDRKQLSYEKYGRIIPAWVIPEKAYPHLIRRIKLVARLNNINRSENGEFEFNHNDFQYKLSVHAILTSYGEYISMYFTNKRRPDQNTAIKRLGKVEACTKLCQDKIITSDMHRENIVIDGMDLRAYDFEGMDLSSVIFVNALLERANFQGAFLLNVHFENCNLEYAVFIMSNLSGAFFLNCNLRHANFTDAYLQESSLTGSDITDAILTNADLSHVDLSKTTYNSDDLTDALLNEKSPYQIRVDLCFDKGRRVVINGSKGSRNCTKEFVGAIGALLGPTGCGSFYSIQLDNGTVIELYSNEYDFID